MDDKRYLVPMKGSDGSDLTETRFIVSTSSIKNTTSKNKHKPFGLQNKVELDLIKKLTLLNAWNPELYGQDKVFRRYLEQDFNLFMKEYKKEARFVNQRNIFEDKFQREATIPQSLKHDGIAEIRKRNSKNNG